MTALLAGMVAISATVLLADGTVTYTGQGFFFDGTTWLLNSPRCGEDGQQAANDGGTGQFADWNGPGQPYLPGQGYLVWVLTANGATSATITLPDGTHDMFNVGGTFKYASPYFDHNTLVTLPVTASYTGNAKGKVQLVVSHGCPGFEDRGGAWCSPGYWGRADDAAWDLIGVSKNAAFNGNVSSAFYGDDLADNPDLITVLTFNGGKYKGSGVEGTDPRTQDPYPALNPFNATGAYLTDQIPCYQFDPLLVGQEQVCPIDNHGRYKEGASCDQ